MTYAEISLAGGNAVVYCRGMETCASEDFQMVFASSSFQMVFVDVVDFGRDGGGSIHFGVFLWSLLSFNARTGLGMHTSAKMAAPMIWVHIW